MIWRSGKIGIDDRDLLEQTELYVLQQEKERSDTLANLQHKDSDRLTKIEAVRAKPEADWKLPD